MNPLKYCVNVRVILGNDMMYSQHTVKSVQRSLHDYVLNKLRVSLLWVDADKEVNP